MKDDEEPIPYEKNAENLERGIGNAVPYGIATWILLCALCLILYELLGK